MLLLGLALSALLLPAAAVANVQKPKGQQWYAPGNFADKNPVIAYILTVSRARPLNVCATVLLGLGATGAPFAGADGCVRRGGMRIPAGARGQGARLSLGRSPGDAAGMSARAERQNRELYTV